MTIQTFIEKMIEGGFPWQKHASDRMNESDFAAAHSIEPAWILLRPEAWKAVGVALGNKDEMRCDSKRCDTVQCEYAGYWNWKQKMVGLVEAIVYSDMTPEQYLETL